MLFLYPQFLWALLALAIPIAIHLFNFRRIRRVYFSNVQWLREVKTETNAFRRLKHLLILLARCAAVIALVLAFAQPYIPSPNRRDITNPGNVVSIYLDNSFSMQSELGNDKYLELASRYLNELLTVFPRDARFQLLTNDFQNVEQFPVPAPKIQDRLTEMRFSQNYRDLATVHRRQLSLLERNAPARRNQIFWFSDFQKSTAGDLDRIRLDSTQQYYLIPIKAEKTPNLRIDSVWLESPFVKAQETNQLKVRLQSFADEAYNNLVLKLLLDNQQVSTASLTVAPGASAVAEFNFTVETEGVKRGKIVFDDNPVIFDNEYFFVLNAAPRVRILHLSDQVRTPFVQNVYSNESVFAIESLNINNLDNSRLASAELIILDEVRSMSGEILRQLSEFVARGGSVLLIPSVPAEGSAEILNALGIAGAKAQKTDTLGNSRANELALPDIQGEFYRGVFEKIPANMTMPYANATLRWANTGENILLFKNRQPFLSAFRRGRGRVYAFASPLANYSNFARHAIFVPIMYKIAALSKTSSERMAYSFQERSIRLRLPNLSKNQVYRLVNGQQTYIPGQRVVGDELLIDLPEQTLQAGYYELRDDKRNIATLAFNYDGAESVMQFYTAQDLQTRFGKQKNVQIYDLAKTPDLVQTFRARNLQVNLWKYCLVAALVFLAIEIALIRLL